MPMIASTAVKGVETVGNYMTMQAFRGVLTQLTKEFLLQAVAISTISVTQSHRRYRVELTSNIDLDVNAFGRPLDAAPQRRLAEKEILLTFLACVVRYPRGRA